MRELDSNPSNTGPKPFQDDTASMLAPLVADGLDVQVGRLSYGVPRVHFQANMPNAKLRIGSFCSIGGNCKIFVGGAGRHYYDFATTSPLSMMYRQPHNFEESAATKGDLTVSIGSDVWVGEDVIIAARVRIGHGAVIGTRSLVLRDVSPYGIVGGVPARLIKHRFPENVVRCFLKIRWWEWSDALISDNLEYFYTSDLEKVIKRFEGIAREVGSYRCNPDFWM